MKPTGAFLAGLVLALTLTACGGSTGSGPQTPAQVAQQIGATNLHAFDHGPYAKAAMSATWHGRQVVIATFSSDSAKQAYVQTASAFDGPPLKTGPGWVMFPN